MNTLEKYNAIFCDILGVDGSELQNAAYKEYPEWNSMAHIGLIAALEEAFNINFETEDIFSFSNYENGKQILSDRFGISFE